MKRCAAIVVMVGALGAVSAPSAGASTLPRARVQALVCQHALDPPMRLVSLTAVMRPLTGTKRMQLRFSLLRKA
ncbi:MAG: hypothetical protein JOZ69_24805, partial [Myxococcales bacterium]|nr:hypothetical protein [Myxococcales bacterium]